MTPLALAYYGPVDGPQGLSGYWGTDPAMISVLLVLLVFGLTEARHRPAFCLAWLLLALAYISPLGVLSGMLFSALTLHHLLMVSLIAPLLAISLPLRLFRAPLALVSTVTALALWYLPAAHAALWADTRIFWLMQALLLGSATVFWSELLAMIRGEMLQDEWGETLPGQYGTTGLSAAAVMTAGLAAAMALIGTMLLASGQPFYAGHLAGAAAWGLDPLLDQRLAGLMLWIPGLVPLALLVLVLLQSGPDGVVARVSPPQTRL